MDKFRISDFADGAAESLAGIATKLPNLLRKRSVSVNSPSSIQAHIVDSPLSSARGKHRRVKASCRASHSIFTSNNTTGCQRSSTSFAPRNTNSSAPSTSSLIKSTWVNCAFERHHPAWSTRLRRSRHFQPRPVKTHSPAHADGKGELCRNGLTEHMLLRWMFLNRFNRSDRRKA